jgi:hypothetical protein
MGIPKLKYIQYVQRMMEDLPMKKRIKEWQIWEGDKVLFGERSHGKG